MLAQGGPVEPGKPIMIYAGDYIISNVREHSKALLDKLNEDVLDLSNEDEGPQEPVV